MTTTPDTPRSLETAAAGLFAIERLRRNINELIDVEQNLATDLLPDEATRPVLAAFADIRSNVDQAINHAAHPLRQAALAELDATFDPEIAAGRTTILPNNGWKIGGFISTAAVTGDVDTQPNGGNGQ